MLYAPDNKRKLSVDNETSPAKKTKIAHGNGLQRYQTQPSQCGISPGRDREHTTILASGFPTEVTEHQVRHFFKGVAVLGKFTLNYSVGRYDVSVKDPVRNKERSPSSLSLKRK